MDVTGNYNGEDYKQDFLDFMIPPGLNEQNIVSTDYSNKQLKSLGLFYDNYDLNESKETKQKADNGKRNPIADESEKETNNNHLLMSSNSNVSYPPYWESKDDIMKWDTTMLVDENIDWSSPINDVPESSSENNTDGSIYTLTVLNNSAPNTLLSDGTDKTITSWYRDSPDVHNINAQPNEKSENQTLHQTTNSDMLVIDSFLNIIPNTSSASQPINVPSSLSDKNNKPNASVDNSFEQMKLNKSTNSLNENHPIMGEEDNYYIRNNSSNVNKIISEMNLGENSDEQHKKSLTQPPIKTEWIGLQSNISSDLSLLRNALQGKSQMRYNGAPEKVDKVNEYSTKHIHSSINTNSNSNTSSSCLNQFNEDNQMSTMSPTTSEHRILLYNNQQNHDEERLCSRIGILDSGSENTNVDDIFLSHLDSSVPFPEDYEKLKSIENEVAESVSLNSPYYFNNNGSNNDTATSSSSYMHSSMIPPNTLMNPLFPHNEVPNLEIASTTSPSMNSNFHTPGANIQKSRKYKRPLTNKASTSNGAGNSVKSANIANTSGGLRKERSLHYCNICNKGFKDKYSVNVHIRTHTGEKPFACGLCGKSFRQKAHLAKHYHTHITGASKASHASSSSTNSSNKNS